MGKLLHFPAPTAPIPQSDRATDIAKARANLERLWSCYDETEPGSRLQKVAAIKLHWWLQETARLLDEGLSI